MKLAALALACILSLGAGEPPATSIKLSANFGGAPLTLRVDTRTEQHPDNRALCVTIDGPNYFRSSCEQLDGDKAPKFSRFEFRDIPGGDYVVVGEVIRTNDRHLVTAAQPLQVISAR